MKGKGIGLWKMVLLVSVVLLTVFQIGGCGKQNIGNIGQDKNKKESTSFKPVTLKVAYSASTSAMPTLVAYEEGYFKEEGIKIELEPQVSGPKSTQAIHLGQIQVGMLASVPLIQAAAAGANVIAVANNGIYGRENPQAFLSATTKSGIKSLQDLKGKTIAINGFGTHSDIVLRSDVFPKLGLEVGKNVTLVELPWSQHEASLMSGAIDVSMAFEPYPTKFRENPNINVFSDLKEVTPPEGYLVSTITMPKDFVQKNPEVVRRFVKAFDRGIAKMNKNPEAACACLEKYTKLDAKLLMRIPMYKFYPGAQPHLIPVDQVRSFAQKMKDQGVIDSVPAIKDFIWEGARP